MAQRCDLVLVVGSANSSNSNRLRELADRLGTEAYLIDSADHIQAEWLEGKSCIGVTAGASAPEVLVEEVVDRLKEIAPATAVESDGQVESIVFSLPKALQK
jgi:4-hydroxy-3-methylbut-2-enyl diphosphate reductase